jgi:hypothetical protein
MIVPRKSSTGQNATEARNSRVSEESRFSDNSARLSKTSRDFRQYRKTIAIGLIDCLSLVEKYWMPVASVFVATVTHSAVATTWLKQSYEAIFQLKSLKAGQSIAGNIQIVFISWFAALDWICNKVEKESIRY